MSTGKRIPELPVAASLSYADLFEISQNIASIQTSGKVSFSSILTAIGVIINPTLTQVLSNGNSTGATNIIVDNSAVLYIGSDQTRGLSYSTSFFIPQLTIFNNNSFDTIVLPDTGGIVFSSSLTQFSYATASTVPYFNALNNLVSSAVTPTELGYLSGATSSIQTQFTGKLSLSGGTMTGALILYSNTPSVSLEAASKGYVDSLIEGLDWKKAVITATSSNIVLSGSQGVNGVVVVTNDRVGVKDQTDQKENGIYIANSAGAWSRSTDTSTGTELEYAVFEVLSGNLVGKVYRCSTFPITIGVTNIVFSEWNVASYLAGSGITLTGTTFSIAAGAITNAMLAGSIDLTTKVTGILSPSNGGTGVANNASSTLAIIGSFATTLTISGITSLTLPTSGTVAVISDLTTGYVPYTGASSALNLGSKILYTTSIISSTAVATGISLVSTTTGDVTIDSGTTGNVLIGTNANGKGITIGNSTGATGINIGAGTGGIIIGGNAVVNQVQLGTGAASKVITIGNITGTTSVTINAGSGNNSINTTNGSFLIATGTGVINIGTDAFNKPIIIGNVTGTTSINFNTGTGGTVYTTTNGAWTLNTGTGNIGIGIDAVAKIITIGNVTGATTINNNCGTGTSTWTTTNGAWRLFTGTGAINIGSDAAAKLITIGNNTTTSAFAIVGGTNSSSITTTNGNLTVNTGTGSIAISNDATNASINIGTGAGNKAITIGSVTGTSSINHNGGSNTNTWTTTNAGWLLNTGTGSIQLGTDAAAKTIIVGNVTAGTTVNFNTGTGGSTFTTTNGAWALNTGTGAINIGTDAVAKIITIGNATGAARVDHNTGSAICTWTTTNGGWTLATGTGTINISADATINTLNIGTGGAAKTLNLLSSTGKIGFFGATAIVRITTGVAASTFVANTSGTLNDSATWDSYTIGQVVKALRNYGILT